MCEIFASYSDISLFQKARRGRIMMIYVTTSTTPSEKK